MLTAEIMGRLVTQIAPELSATAWSAWATASSSFRGEDCELAAIFRVLIEANAIATSDLIDLGATQRQIAIATADVALVLENLALGSSVVLRRHAEPGTNDGLCEQGLQAAESLARLSSFDFVRCGPSTRTLRALRI